MQLLRVLTLSLAFVTINSSNDQTRIGISIDDILNTGLNLFPNYTLNYQMNLEDQTLERFKFLLEDDSILTSAYDSFKKKYPESLRNTGSPATYTIHQRKQFFKENLIFIFRHNLLTRLKGYSSFEMGTNKFSDMHLDEFKDERLGLIFPDGYGSESTSQTKNNSVLLSAPSLPSSFDWRDHRVISPVKDQLECAACIMFSVASLVEAAHAIKNKGGPFLDLSEQFMIDCATRKNGFRKNRGCFGNEFEDTLRFAVIHGITSESISPYVGKQNSCKFDGKDPVLYVKGFEHLPENEAVIKQAVVEKGPVAIGMPVYKELIYYQSGIYSHCSHPSNAIAGHSMLITGYKDDAKVKYYNLKNQWGTDWGEKGFVRYVSSDANCRLSELAFSVTV